MVQSLLSNTTSVASILSVSEAVCYSLVAGVLGLLIALTYIKTGKYTASFARTLITLPMLVCVVMLIVNGNLGASVAIMGAFSLVRFRSLQGTAREISYIFFVMTVGLVCSVGSLGLAVIITVAVCFINFALNLIKFAEKQDDEKELKITIPENLDYTEIFDDVMDEYTKDSKIVRVKTTNMGSMYEITYRIKMKDERLTKKFIDDIRIRNGNLTVVIGRCDLNVVEVL